MAKIKGTHGGRRLGAGRKIKHGQRRHKRPVVSHGGWRQGAGRKSKRPGQWAIYVVHEAEDLGVCKIGITGMSMEQRLTGLQVGNWRQLIPGAFLHVSSDLVAIEVEHRIHRKLAERRIKGEWFRITLQGAIAAVGEAMAEAAIDKELPDQRSLF